MANLDLDIILAQAYGTSTETFAVIDPATEEEIAQVKDATVEDALDALSYIDSLSEQWAATTPQFKADILYAIFETVREHTDYLATIMSTEMGKPLAEARGEIAYGNEYFRWFSQEATRIPGRISPAPSGSGTIAVTRQPVGPVLAITPWNFPLAMATRKIAPALAAGCPIIVKPARETPLTMLALGHLINEVFARFDFPNVVVMLSSRSSAKISQTLMNDARLRKVTFTGSTAVGKKLVEQSATHLLRMSMELGGNAPFVIAADADINATLTCALQAKMRNGGQACIAANRFIVEEPLVDAFATALAEKMDAFIMGHGCEEKTTLGPMITKAQRDGIHELVQDAIDRGATVLSGGYIPQRAGFFYPATVLRDIPRDAPILKTEIFGPVATIISVPDLDAAIKEANSTEFGLAAYGFTQSLDTAHRFAKELRAGMVGINRGAISDPAAPFGGIKESGFGREGGSEGIEEYLDTKYIALP